LRDFRINHLPETGTPGRPDVVSGNLRSSPATIPAIEEAHGGGFYAVPGIS
jgi:hypothetical protein